MTLKLTSPENAPQSGTYRHYKGPLYQVLGMAQHSETDEWMVVYQALYGEYGFWLRPLSVWLEPIATPLDTHSNEAQSDQREHPAPGDAASEATQTTQRFTLVTPSNSSLTQLTKMNSANGV